MNANVVWKDILGYEGLYQISSDGQVKSLVGWNGRKYVHREKILKQSKTTTGYKKVELSKDGKRKSVKVHRIVAYAFIPQVEGKTVVNHKDGNPLNNNYKNLEWCTQRENVLHALESGLKKLHVIEEFELKGLYEDGKSVVQISKELGTTPSIVYNNMKKYGIKRRKSSEYKDKYHIDLEQLKEDFVNGKTNRELSRKYKCTENLIAVRRYQFRKRGII